MFLSLFLTLLVPINNLIDVSGLREWFGSEKSCYLNSQRTVLQPDTSIYFVENYGWQEDLNINVSWLRHSLPGRKFSVEGSKMELAIRDFAHSATDPENPGFEDYLL